MSQKNRKNLKAQMVDEDQDFEKSLKETDLKQDTLSSEDINTMLKEEEILRLKPLPYLEFFGRKINLDSLIISALGLILWICIWKFFNLFDIGKYSLIFFFIYVFIVLFNIFNSSVDTERNLELATYEIEKQITNVEAAMGIIIILYVFLYNIQMDSESRILSYKLLTIIMVLCSISIIKYSLKNDSINVRTIRIITEKFYNQAIILFSLCLVVIYFGIIKK